MTRAEKLLYRNERWMYRDGRPNRVATFLNRIWAMFASAGLGRRWLVTLEVRGRRSGRVISAPLIAADLGGERYLVSMLGERASWVANVRAAGGMAVLREGRSVPVKLVEVPVVERGPIIRRYLQVAPAARSFAPLDWRAPDFEFDRVAADYPVFRICPAEA